MTFDPFVYKATTRGLWQSAAEAWHRWGPTLGRWLGPATELMLDMAGIRAGSRVLDVAAGAGEQTLVAARRVGPTGFVLATDIAPNILALAAEDARRAGLTHVETREMDGEHLDFEEGVFDAAISRLGLMFFPDRRISADRHTPGAESRRQRCRHRLLHGRQESAFLDPDRDHSPARPTTAPAAGAAWSVQPRGPGRARSSL